MNNQSDRVPPKENVAVLVSDLDGTLIPLQGNSLNQADLQILDSELRAGRLKLAFATGRHFESVRQAIRDYRLPSPDWIICNVGSSIYRLNAHHQFGLCGQYEQHLLEITGGLSVEALEIMLLPVPGLRRQEDEKQMRFKLSYYTGRAELQAAVDRIRKLLADQSLPYSVIASIDPFTDDGLVDLLPRGISKAYALQWWAHAEGYETSQVIYAGDSGNDAAAFAHGYRSIIVHNASSEVRQAAVEAHRSAGWSGRIFAATAPATSGVLQGLRHFQKASTRSSEQLEL